MPIHDINTNTESDSSHPTDGFSVVRFAVRIPIIVEVDEPASLPLWRPKPSSDDADDGDDDDGMQDMQDTQCFELCFHSGFAPNPDPVSLHMLSSGRIEHHDPAPVLRTPRPPCYIHELPDLIDLTDTMDDATTSATPVASNARSTRLVVQLLLTMLLYTIAVLSGGLVLGRHLHPSNAHMARPHPQAQKHGAPSGPPFSFSLPPPHETYVLDIAAEPTTQALSLYKDVLPLERLHLAAAADVAEVMATDPDLGLDCELNKLVSRMCRDVSFFVDNELVPSSTPATLYADIKLTCQHIFDRFLKLHRPLRDLKATNLHKDYVDTKLSFAAWMLDTAVEGGYSFISLPQAYAKSLLDPDREVWQQCRFCDSSPPPVGIDIAAAVAVADWHFACDPSFLNLSASLASRPAAAVNNYFTSWGKHQSARRFAALRNSPLDVDDTPLYPNNQHPFDEADDIHTWLPSESPLNDVLRNIVETATAVDELLDLLGALNISAVSGSQENDTKPSPPEVSSALSRPSWWQMLRSQPRSAPIAGSRRVAIRQGTARLAELQNDLLTPLVRSLGGASASMTMACVEADKQRARMGRLAAGRDWERPTAHIVVVSGQGNDGKDENTKNEDVRALSSTNTVIVHVARTVFTADMAAEASALRAESAERLAERQSAVAAAKVTATMRFLASRELAAARFQASITTTTTTTTPTPTTRFKQAEELEDEPPLPPMTEEDLAFEQRVRDNLDEDPLRRLASLLRGG